MSTLPGKLWAQHAWSWSVCVCPDHASQFQGRKQPWASLIRKKSYSTQAFLGPSAISEIFQRLSKAGFHSGDIPQLRQGLSHSGHLGCISFLPARCRCQQRCSQPHVALTSPNRYWGWAQQATHARSFHLRLWRTNKRQGNRKPWNISIK